MLLSTILEQAGISYDANTIANINVLEFADDSREVTAGSVFCAVHGYLNNADQFMASACHNGAIAVLFDARYTNTQQSLIEGMLPNTNVPAISVDNLHQRMGQLLNLLHNTQAKQSHVVGITGTDGKTSISHMLAQMDPQQNAIIGTLGAGRLAQLTHTGYTTPNAVNSHRWIKQLSADGVAQIAMEVSSHGLDQGRINGINIHTAVLSNFGRDHLDYHHDLAHYKASKAKLFGRNEVQNMVLNMDDDFGAELIEAYHQSKRVIAYGMMQTAPTVACDSLRASDVQLTPEGISAVISYHPHGSSTSDRQYTLHTTLMAGFNIYNLLAVAGVYLANGHDFNATMRQLEKIQAIPGRMQRINDQGRVFVVDYAHTPQALELSLKALRDHQHSKIICVFGCGGDRDKGKRALMATAAERHADLVIVTDDNPRNESASAIFADISQGFSDSNHVHFIHDRQESIDLAAQQAQQGDAILIAGKGHENVQIIGAERIPFSDIDAVQQAIARRSA